LDPSKQAVALATALSYISDLIVRSTMRERLYERRYGSKYSEEDQKTFMPSHLAYRDTLKALYVQILKFQASSVCYLSKTGAFQLGSDLIKWDNWDSSLNGIQQREDAFYQVYSIWKDIRDQEDCERLYARHQENINVMVSISGDVSGLCNAIEKAQRDTQRTRLLNWLSTINPSKFYNLGLDKLRADTGEWLLNGNLDFEKWQTSPNSFAWLNGKGISTDTYLYYPGYLLTVSLSWLWKISIEVR
jgi:N-terminal domain of NWD NACHT-NTPase